MKKLTTQFEEVKLVYRNKTKAQDRPQVKSPDAAYEILIKSWDLDQIGLLEESKILLLDRNLRLMSVASISKGGYAGTVIDTKVVFAIALKRRAHSIILAHNHPSGNLKPSHSDIELTKQFVQAGEIMQIPVNDHLIINEDDFCSMMSEGYIP